MSRTDYRTLIDRGRKAGLGTSELYRAIAGQRGDDHQGPGQTDGNGFVASVTQSGQRVYQPIGSYRRP
jgi:hypothetical protein